MSRLVNLTATASIAFGLVLAPWLGGCTMLSGAEDLEARGAEANTTVQAPTVPKTNSDADDGDEASSSSSKDDGTTPPSSSPAPGTEAPATPFVPKPTVPKAPLECDGNMCGGGDHCCQTGNARGQCVGATDACGGTRITCEPSDCSTGEVCCAFSKHKLAACVTASECAAPDTSILCNADADCNGKACTGGSEALHHAICE